MIDRTEGFFALLRELDERLKPHIHLGSVRFASGDQGAEIIHDPDEETRLDELNDRRAPSNKEIAKEFEELRKLERSRKANATSSGFTLLTESFAKKPEVDGTVIGRTSPSLAELACRELRRSDIRRFISKANTGELTSLEYKRFEGEFLRAIRRVVNRELRTAIKKLPVPIRGRKTRLPELDRICREAERSKQKTATVKELAKEYGYGEDTIWRRLRERRSTSVR